MSDGFVFQLSSVQSRQQQIQVEYMLGPQVLRSPYHVVLSRLTRNLEVLHPEIWDEICHVLCRGSKRKWRGICFYKCVMLIHEHSEWKSVPALCTVKAVIYRTSNRVFVNLPLCMLPACRLSVSFFSSYIYIEYLIARDVSSLQKN